MTMKHTKQIENSPISLEWVENGRILVRNDEDIVHVEDYTKTALNRIIKWYDTANSKKTFFICGNVELLRMFRVDWNINEDINYVNIDMEYDPIEDFGIIRHGTLNKAHISNKSKNVLFPPIDGFYGFVRGNRYRVLEDGSICHLEEVSVENLFAKYGYPVITCY